MIRKTIVIEVEDIYVDSEFFSFLFEVIIDGESVKKGIFDGDHSRKDDVNVFEDLLNNGHAHQLVINDIKLDY